MKYGKYIRHIFIAIAVIAGICFFSTDQVYAKNVDSKEQALRAYRSMLSKKKIQFHEVNEKISSAQCKYAILYVDNDNIPELVIDATDAEQVTHASGYFNLYTFRNGKVRYIANTSDGFRYVKKSGVFLGNYAGMGTFDDWYCLIDGTTYKEFAKVREDFGMQDPYDENSKPLVTYFNDFNEKKEITKKQFDRIVQKYVKGKPIIEPHFQKNTYHSAQTKKDTVMDAKSDRRYRNKIGLLEKKYGVFQVEGYYDLTPENKLEYSKGVSFLKLIDFNQDGRVELLAVYYDKNKKAYFFNVYTMKGSQCKKVYKGFVSGGGMPAIIQIGISRYQGKPCIYMYEGRSVCVYGMNGNGFELINDPMMESNYHLAKVIEKRKSALYNLNGWVMGTPDGWDDLSAMSDVLFQEINKTKKELGMTPQKTYQRK